MDAVIVGEQVAGESSAVRTELEKLVNNFDKSLFDIGDMLYRVHRNRFYTSWGFNTFKEYITTLNFKVRRAQYLSRIAEVMTELGVPRKQYEPLGIAKLREITSLDHQGTWTDPQGNVIQLADWIRKFVEDGMDLPIEELKTHVRTLKGLVGEHDLCFETYCYTRSVKDNVVEPAKELARRNIGSVGKDEEGDSKDASSGACLEVWAVEYLNNPANNLPEERDE